MKVYVACHSLGLALDQAELLKAEGHEIVSRWLQEPFLKTGEYTVEDRQRIASMDFDDIAACDMVLLIAGPEKYSGGKFVEAGIALGLGKRVAVTGGRENMLLWHPTVETWMGTTP